MNSATLKRLALALCLLSTAEGFGQSAATGVWQDALRFTENNPTYTARMMGIGGAQTGLGADISNAATNPAGLGMLRQSEVSITPSLLFTRTENDYMGTSSSAGASRFHFGNLGVAWSNSKDEVTGGDFRGGTFAITLTRLANFNSRRTFNAISHYAPRPEDYNLPAGTQLTASDSLLPGRNSYNYTYLDILSNPNLTFPQDFFSNTPNYANYNQQQYLIRQGYGGYVLDYDSNSNGLYVTVPNGDVRQSGIVRTTGKSQQLDLAYGANFKDKLYIGGGLGIPFIDYNQQIIYDEQITKVIYPQSLMSANGTDFSFWNGFVTRRQVDLNTSGIGLNARLGVIYKVFDYLRLGASVQTPTVMKMRNEYSSTLSADFGNINIYYPDQNLQPGLISGNRDVIYQTNYNVTSPWKLSAGGSLLSGKYGFISADVTYLNYTGMSLKGRDFDMSADKKLLQTQSKNVLQVRGGAEFRYDFWRFRAGGGYLPDPLKSGKDMAFFSGGLGVRMQDYYLDLGFQRYVQKQSYQVYNGSESAFTTAPISSSIRNTIVQITLGNYF